MLGLSKSSLVLRFLPRSNLAGVLPVVLCGVVQYARRILASLELIDPFVVFLDLSSLFVQPFQLTH